jgi:large subunit ribosomal protein L4
MNSPRKNKSTNKSEVLQVLSAKEFDNISEKPVNPIAFSTWIRQLMLNWRQGTVSVKERSEVSFSNKKPWKQKGTGRARAGSARSPLWRHGGVMHGPQKRTRTLDLPQQAKNVVRNNLFWQFLNAGKIVGLDWALSGDRPQTSQAHEAFNKASLHDKKITLFLAAQDYLHYASVINIKNVQIVFFDQANAYDLVSADYWVVLNKDFDTFREMVASWN